MRDVGPLTDEYSLTSDWDNQWLTGGLEGEVIAEAAHLDPEVDIHRDPAIRLEREQRLNRQRKLLAD